MDYSTIIGHHRIPTMVMLTLSEWVGYVFFPWLDRSAAGVCDKEEN